MKLTATIVLSFPARTLAEAGAVVEGGPLHTHVATSFVHEDRLFEDTTVVVDARERLRVLGMDPGATLRARSRA